MRGRRGGDPIRAARAAWCVALLVGAWACVRGQAPDEARPADPVTGDGPTAPVGADGARAAPEDGSGVLELSLDGAPPGPAPEVLARAPGRAGVDAHAEHAGWSADGRTFEHCWAVPGLECTECRAIDVDGASRSLASGPGCGEGAVDRAALEAHVAALGRGPQAVRWASGGSAVLVLETREVETTNAGDPRPMLKLGARPRAGGAPAWLLHVDPCEGCGIDQACAAAAHLDALVPSPGGDWLAVLVHQRGTRGDQSLRVELLPAARVAAAARPR